MKIPKFNAFIINSYFRSLSTISGKGNAEKNIVIMDLKTIQTHLDRLEVLHKSENFLVVNKDFDVVLNTENPARLSVFGQLAHKFPELVSKDLSHGFYVAHRLDYSTSGVLLIPLTKQASAQAARCFEKRKTQKYYLALVEGHLTQENIIEINAAIGKDSRPEFEKIRMCTESSKFCAYPKSALTKALLLERGYYKDEPVSKILLYPKTGRRHQLRIHCKLIGHTILGDFTYCNENDEDLRRMFLHAFRLKVPCALEDIDLRTNDPFTESEDNLWKVRETFYSVDEGIQVIDKSMS